MPDSEILVRLEAVSKSFGDHVVLNSLDLTLRRGETLAVLGQSGSGKSVLLKIIIGLLPPDAGDVDLWGRSITRLSEEEMIPLRRKMGFVFQAGALFDSMTVGENIAFAMLQQGRREGPDLEGRVEELLDWVGLKGTAASRPSDLSGGMRKRAALARTLGGDPELILYDEPTTGLDPLTGHSISCLIRDVGARIQATSIVVTHDVDCAMTVARRWAFLHDGRILADGTPRELFASQDPDVREFLSLWSSMGANADRGGADDS